MNSTAASKAVENLPTKFPSRRTVAKGIGWSAPILAIGAQTASAVVSGGPCTGCVTCGFGGGDGGLSYWTSGTGSSATWSKCGVSVTFGLSMVSGTALANNGRIGTTADGLAGGSGIGDSSVMNGLVLNMQGSASVRPLQQITISFSKPVCNFQMYMRDVSWYSNATGASDRDAVYFDRAPTSVTSYLGRSASGATSPNGAIMGSGSSAAPVMRSACCGTVPAGNGYYYDLQANWTGSMQYLTMYYTNGTGPSTDKMYMQIRDLSYCY